MKSFRNGIFLILCLIATNTRAQSTHYVYIQTENRQPFYVKTQDILYSSSESGYVILTKLDAGLKKYVMGFPKNQWPSQTFIVDVTIADRGFELKKDESGRWTLVDISTKEVIESIESGRSANNTTAKQDEFSNVLARVTDNPSILQNNADNQGSSMKSNESINKIYAAYDSNGRTLKYTIFQNGRVDTISLYISYRSAVESSHTLTEACNKEATNDDFIQLRRNMISQDNESLMLNEVQKSFKETCFSTNQVKSLSMLIMNEPTRFELLKSSLKHISDKENLPELQSVLTDKALIKSFRKLID